MPDPTLIRLSPERLFGHLFAVAWPVIGQCRQSPAGSEAQLYRGTGYIAGTVTSGGLPASRPVRLYHRATGAFVASARSDAAGEYRFNGLAVGEEFIVLATDADSDHYNAAVADMILPAAP